MRTRTGTEPKSGGGAWPHRFCQISARQSRGDGSPRPRGAAFEPARLGLISGACSRAPQKCILVKTKKPQWLRRSLQSNRNNPMSNFLLAAALAHLERMDEAQSEAAEDRARPGLGHVARVQRHVCAGQCCRARGMGALFRRSAQGRGPGSIILRKRGKRLCEGPLLARFSRSSVRSKGPLRVRNRSG